MPNIPRGANLPTGPAGPIMPIMARKPSMEPRPAPTRTVNPATGTSSFSDQQLRNQAAAEVTQSLQQETAPYLAEQQTLRGDEGRALQGITNMFGQIDPFVAQSAQSVKAAYDEGQAREQAIFNEYGQNLNQVGQDAAARAQKLSQEMGGPVAAGEFQAASAPDQAAYGGYAGGALLAANMFAQSGEQAAQAFAGQVFPALQTEQAGKARQYYQDQIKTIQGTIDRLHAGKSNSINTRYNQLLINQQNYKLNQAQLQLQRLKADRDWAATKAALGLKGKQLDFEIGKTRATLQQGQQALNLKALGLQLQGKKLDAYITNQAASLGIRESQLRLNLQRLNQNSIVANRRLDLSEQKNAASYIDAATTGGHPITLTTAVPITTAVALTTAHNAFTRKDPKTGKTVLGPDGKPQYFITRNITTQPPGQQPLHDPTAVYHFLVSHMPYSDPRMLRNMVIQRFSLPRNWRPGK